MFWWRTAACKDIFAYGMDNVEQQHSFEPDNMVGNEASRQSFKAFRKFPNNSGNHGSDLDVIRLDAVMTAYIDALRSTPHYVT